jgi:hypothetical protein
MNSESGFARAAIWTATSVEGLRRFTLLSAGLTEIEFSKTSAPGRSPRIDDPTPAGGLRIEANCGLNRSTFNGKLKSGGVTNFNRTTAHSTCCTAGRFLQQRQTAQITGIKSAIISVF